MSAPYYEDEWVTLHAGDCLDVLRSLPDASVDAVVCDPPYGLGFMGKEWDDLPPGEEWSRECLRVLKPGGHLLAFGGTRTWHRLACAIEDAGFEVRDSIAWLYGSGFPKSLDVSKAIDKARTEDRAPIDAVRSWLNERRLEAGFTHDDVNAHFGHARNGGGSSSAWMTNPTSRNLPTWEQWLELKRIFSFGDEQDAEVWRLNGRKGKPGDNFEAREVLAERTVEVKGGTWSEGATGRFRQGEKVIQETAPATPDAARWQGWGTALKPAFEPIVVARKPLVGTVAANVLAHGTGALNIDGCRVGYTSEADKASARPGGKATSLNGALAGKEQICETPNTAAPTTDISTTSTTGNVENATSPSNPRTEFEVVQGAGRWPANVVLDESQAEVLDEQSGELPTQATRTNPNRESAGGMFGLTADGERSNPGAGETGGASRFFYVAKADSSERVRVNGTAHPTVKPLALMRWLVRLVTPPGGTVLEPFAGSGTTVEACLLEGFHCIAIEREADYLPLIVQRINRRRDPVAAVKAAGDDEGLFGLLDGEAS